MKLRKFLFFFISLIGFNSSYSQIPECDEFCADSDPIAAMLDSLVSLNFLSRYTFSEQTAPLTLPHAAKYFSDEEYKAKLKKLNSPIPLDYNESVRNYIELYGNRRPALTSRVLGLAQMYFPMFEQTLDQQSLPLEFKYLAIVESALNPTAVSKAGATGLWQFMYNTGKIYDLKITSYIDERRDPQKATLAACKYFKDMFGIYQDWLLVIAAYNCGERNVNKAILRAGGKTNFWQIKRYLPKETQGYVPAFIAVNYIMNYNSDFGIGVTPPAISFYETDTIAVNQHLSFTTVASTLDIPLDEIRYLNPIFKKNFVPYTGDPYQILLPSNKIASFIANADKIYNGSVEDGEKAGLRFQYVTSEKKQLYTVKKGETLASIAKKKDCTIADLKQWNKLKGKSVVPGKQLIVFVTVVEKITIPDSAQAALPDTTSVQIASEQPETTESHPDYIMYKVQPNDTLFSIARQQRVSVEQIKELNKDVLSNPNKLVPGSVLKISKKG